MFNKLCMGMMSEVRGNHRKMQKEMKSLASHTSPLTKKHLPIMVNFPENKNRRSTSRDNKHILPKNL